MKSAGVIEDRESKIENVAIGLDMAKGDDIQERLVWLAVAVIRICDDLPHSSGAGQIAS
jgi:hypothetical protein